MFLKCQIMFANVKSNLLKKKPTNPTIQSSANKIQSKSIQ